MNPSETIYHRHSEFPTMNDKHNAKLSMSSSDKKSIVDRKLATYLAAVAGGTMVAQEAEAVVVSNTTVQPFGINQDVNIDFNSDGQIDFQIDHDRVNLNGTNLDYLQLDKNDISSAADPYPIDPFAVFPVPNGQNYNWDHGYTTDGQGSIGYYPSALLSGAEIGPLSFWDFQEGDNFGGSGNTIRANRLIDEDATQIDADAGAGTQLPSGSPGWVGLGGQVRYLGVRVDLQDAGFTGNEYPTVNGPGFSDNPANYWYGWIGVRITNEADATGEVVGYAYENQLGMSILAGETAPPSELDGDYNEDGKVDAADYVVWRKTDGTPAGLALWKANFGEMAGAGAGVGAAAGGNAVPEPSSLLLGLGAGMAMIGAFVFRRIKRP
jgi:hypothetical protein